MGKGSAGVIAMPTSHVVDDNNLPLKRAFNFCAGPAMLDSSAMQQMQTEFLSWQQSGISLIEMSQRDTDGPVQKLIAAAIGNIRELLAVPANYRILLFQGGAHGQFAAVPLNLCKSSHLKAQYIDGGFWSRRAASEASKFAQSSVAASTFRCPSTGELRYPDASQWCAIVLILCKTCVSGLSPFIAG
jgi:phosphoserine aminotransferase